MKLFRSRMLLHLVVATPFAAACTGGPSTGDATPDASDVAHDTPTTNEASVDAADAPADSPADAGPDAPADAGDAGSGLLTVTASSAVVSDWTCGDPFPMGGDVTLRNDGGAPAAYHSGWSGPYATTFTTTGPTSGTLAPGASVTIHVAPVRWVFDTTPLAARNAVFHVYADNGAIGGGDVPVGITPHGAVLVADTTESNFGDVRVGSNAMIGYSMSNVGDRDATLVVGSITDPQFVSSVAAGSYTVAAHDSRFDTATFTPTHGGNSVAMLSFSTSGPVCYSNLATRTFRGNGTTGNIAVSGDIDFGLTLCGGTAAPRTITLTNSGAAPASFTASLAAGSTSHYRLSATSGTVAPGAPYTLTVTPEALPNLVPSLPGDFGDIVVIGTDVPGDTQHIVHLSQGARGAILSWDRSSVNLAAAVGQTATASLLLSNSGTEPATVQLISSLSETSVVPSEPALVPAHGSIAANVSFTATSETQRLRSAVFPMLPIAGLCQLPPARVVVDAHGSSGELLLDRDAIDFGGVDCGSSASERTLLLTNPTPSAVNVHARLAAASSPFTLSVGTATPSGNVDAMIPAGGSISLTVHAPAIAAMPAGTDAMNDQILIVSDAPSDTGHLVPVHLQPTGAIVAVDVTGPVDLGTIPTGTSVGRTIAFTNTGSVPVDVRLTAGTDFYWTRDLLTLPAGGTPVFSTLTGFARTNGTTMANFDVAIVSTTATCAPLPATQMVQVTGAAGVVSISHTVVDFGRNPCRQAPPSPRGAWMQNTGTIPFTFDATADGPFRISPTSGTVAPGEWFGIQVTAQPIIDDVPGRRRGGTLVITTNVPGDAPHFVQLRDTVDGALLSLPPTTLDFGGARVGDWVPRGLGIYNHGTYPAPIVIAGGSGMSSPFSADAYVAAYDNFEMLATFHPLAAGTFSEDWTLSVPADTPLCAPFAPAPVHVTGTGAVAQLYAFPSSVDVGGVVCDGSTPSTQTVELRNPGLIPVTFGARLDRAPYSWMSISPTGGDIPPNGSVTITITPRTLTTDLLIGGRGAWDGMDDQLRVDFNGGGAGGGTFYVPLRAHSVGAVFGFSHTRSDFDLSVAGGWQDFASLETSGRCSYGFCNPRWQIDLTGPIHWLSLNHRDAMLGFDSTAAAGATAVATARDTRPSEPICHAPPSVVATWTAIP